METSEQEIESWVRVDWHPTWCISSFGRVASVRVNGTLRLLKGSLKGRYFGVMYNDADGRPKTSYIHHLVCEAFHGSRPDGCVVRHLDGFRFNNRSDNLAWGTVQENIADNVRLKVSAGERNGMARLNRATVEEMRQLRTETGMSHRLIGERFGVSTMTAWRAVEMQSWK